MTVAPFDYAGMRATSDDMVRSAGMLCKLRRGGVERDCWAVIYNYRTKDAASQLANPTDRAALIAAGLGDVPNNPPDWELDKLVTFVQPLGTVVDEVLAFGQPVKPIRPAGLILVYEAVVRR